MWTFPFITPRVRGSNHYLTITDGPCDPTRLKFHPTGLWDQKPPGRSNTDNKSVVILSFNKGEKLKVFTGPNVSFNVPVG